MVGKGRSPISEQHLSGALAWIRCFRLLFTLFQGSVKVSTEYYHSCIWWTWILWATPVSWPIGVFQGETGVEFGGFQFICFKYCEKLQIEARKNDVMQFWGSSLDHHAWPKLGRKVISCKWQEWNEIRWKWRLRKRDVVNDPLEKSLANLVLFFITWSMLDLPTVCPMTLKPRSQNTINLTIVRWS